MKETVYRKLEGLVERYEEVQAMLSDAGVISDQNRFRELSKNTASSKKLRMLLLCINKPSKIWSALRKC